MKKLSNTQQIYRSDKTTKELKGQLSRALKSARNRMSKLKSAKLSKSEFYQSHKKDFKEDILYKVGNNRLKLSKELAKVNQFLNSKSSTPSGLKKSERQFIEVMNERYDDKFLNKKNVREFQKFMKEFKELYGEQSQLDSDKAVDSFKEAERLKINKKDMLENLELFIENEEDISNMNLEDMFEDGKIDKRRRFNLDDYLFNR